ncbi:MAG: Type 1 glutamine amidotransferase-like domain-containing protein [Acutalibacteraceae bacterium]
MKVFLCGGGAGEQTAAAYNRFNAVIDHTKPLLYIPLAMESESYDSCYEWICGELESVDVPKIDMVRSPQELSLVDLFEYSALFIGGGNTFTLLKRLKAIGCFDKIKDYYENGGIVFGSSAGAIIFGEDLEPCSLDDANEVNLTQTDGFNILNGISFLCHYTNRSIEKDEQSRRYLTEISNHRKVIALPEEITLFVNGNTLEVIGNKPYYYFENGKITAMNGE